MQIARYCLDKGEVDEVRFIPTRYSLSKASFLASSWTRAAMVALAISNEKNFYLDVRELVSSLPSYAVLTLQSLREEFPENQLRWIIGQDALVGLETWYCWEKIPFYCDMLMFPRLGSPPIPDKIKEVFDRYEHPIVTLDMPAVSIASSIIRKAWKEHEHNLPPAVWCYINENNLYNEKSV